MSKSREALWAASAFYTAAGAALVASTGNAPAGFIVLATAAGNVWAAYEAGAMATTLESWVRFYCDTRLKMLYTEATTGGQMPPQEAGQRKVEHESGWTDSANGSSISLPTGQGVFEPVVIAAATSRIVEVRQRGSALGETLEETINRLPLDLRDVAREKF